MSINPVQTIEEPLRRIAVFGGVYSNYLALERVLADARSAGVDGIFCLGDLGAFGPHPDRAIDMLRARDSDVRVMQGNYDHSVGNRRDDCACGYTDPRDNHYAQISYDYTLANTNEVNRDWLRDLPGGFRLKLGGHRVALVHGSPRRTNEFLWGSTTPAPFIRRLLAGAGADVIVCTHTGLHWSRFLGDERGSGHRAHGAGVVNVGVIGRPANDGDPAVWYALLEADDTGGVGVEFRRVEYDHESLARDMEREALPREFIETIRTGWWTTCLEVLPARERARSRY
jgi:diadenosine tetraphosphatase ApaH/serine/threonine PP2A family protein phosphatase